MSEVTKCQHGIIPPHECRDCFRDFAAKQVIPSLEDYQAGRRKMSQPLAETPKSETIKSTDPLDEFCSFCDKTLGNHFGPVQDTICYQGNPFGRHFMGSGEYADLVNQPVDQASVSSHEFVHSEKDADVCCFYDHGTRCGLKEQDHLPSVSSPERDPCKMDDKQFEEYIYEPQSTSVMDLLNEYRTSRENHSVCIQGADGRCPTCIKADLILNSLSTEPETARWIDCKQELPPLDADNCCMDEADYGRYSNPVLVFEEDEAIVTTAVYDSKKDEWSDARNGGQFFGVTHWMKTPAPPGAPETAPIASSLSRETAPRSAKSFMLDTYGSKSEFGNDGMYETWMGVAHLAMLYFMFPPSPDKEKDTR